MATKLFLLAVLILTGLALWILPRTKMAQKLRMSIKVFYSINIIGVIFGTLGLIVSFLYPELIMEKHYYELILLPIFLSYMYFVLIQIVNKSKDILDEKQSHNMSQAAALTWSFSIFWMFAIFAMYKESILAGLIFFPIFIYFSLAVYSGCVLYMFNKY